MANLPYISPDIIAQYSNQIAKTASLATAKRKMASLRKFFDWAHSTGHIKENPLEEVPQLGIAEAPSFPRFGARVAIGLGVLALSVLLIFLLTRKLQIPIPFLPAPASENGVTQLPQPTPGIIQTTPGTTSTPTILSAWTIFTKMNLKGSDGTPVIGAQTITFKLYKSPDDNTPLWTSSSQQETPDTNGNISIALDNVPTDVFFSNDKLYLSATIGSTEIKDRIPVSSANSASNLQGFAPASPNEGAGPNTIPVIADDGSLLLASQAPAIKATQGNLLVEGQTVTIATPTGSDGNVEINPNGYGYAHFLFEGNDRNFLNAQAPNLTNGSLYYGVVANNATGYDLIRLQSGSNPITRFNVDAYGNTGIWGNLSTGGVQRLSSTGALSNITGYNQTSGNFTITQNPGNFASITQTGTALSDLLTLTLDERNKPMSSYSTLTLNRYNAPKEGAALYVKNGTAIFNDQLQLGSFSANPTAIGTGSIVFNTTADNVYAWTGTSWIPLGGSGAPAFGTITSGTNTLATMIIAGSSSLTYTGTGSINASSLGGYAIGALPFVNDATNPTLTRSGSGPYTLGLNLSNLNTWSGAQTFSANTYFPGNGIWNTSGDLGIGTLSPTAKLDVNGTASISGELDLYGNPVIQSTANQNLTLGGATTGNIVLSPLGGTGTVTFSGYGAGIIQSDALGVLSSAAGTANYLPKWSSTAPYLTTTSLIYDNGTNVGINTVSPSETLDVNGNATVSGNLTFYGLSSTIATRNSVNLNIGDLQTGTIQFYNSNNTIDSSGNLTIAGTTTFNGNTYTWPAPLSQSTNYVLTTNGSGSLDWSDPAILAGATNFWTQTATGALFPKNSTVDVLIGGSSTDSAKFAFLNVNSGNPTASIAGNLALGAETTSNNPATFLNVYNGGSFNIQGSAGGDTGLASRLFIDNTGKVGINTAAPGAALDVNGNVLVAGNGTIDTSTAGTLGIGTTTQNGLTLGNTSASTSLVGSNVTEGGIGYGDGTNTLAFTAALTGVLEANGTSSPTALTSTQDYVAYWSDANTISGEAQLALSRGGTNADLSGVNAGGLIYMGGSSALTGTDALSGLLYGEGSSGPAAVTGLTDSYLPKYSNSSPYLTDSLIYDNGINVGINTVSPSETLDVNGNATVSGNLTLYGLSTTSGTIATRNSINLNIGDLQTGTIQFYNSNNTLDALGNLTIAGTTTFNGNTYTWPTPLSESLNYVLTTNGSGGLSWNDPTSLAGGTNYWSLTNGAILPKNPTVDLLIGTSNSSTDSAKFAFMNVNSGNPTASISGNLALGSPTDTSNPATFLDVYNGGTFNIQTSVGGDAGLNKKITIFNNGSLEFNQASAITTSTGDLTLSANSATVSVGGNTGNVGIGTTSPEAPLTLYKTDASFNNQIELARLIRDTSGQSQNGIGEFTSTYLPDPNETYPSLLEAGTYGFRLNSMTPGATTSAEFSVNVMQQGTDQMIESFSTYADSGTKWLCGNSELDNGPDCLGFAIGSGNVANLQFDGNTQLSFDASSDVNTIDINAENYGLQLKTLAAQPISFDASNNGVDMYIASTGEVGINTISPTAKLDINGTVTPTTGTNLITNGTFDSSCANWTLGSDVTCGSNDAVSTYAGGNATVTSDTFSTNAGDTYLLTFTISGANAPMYFSISPDGDTYYYGPFSNGTQTVAFPTDHTGPGETLIFDDWNYTNGDTWTLSNVSIKEAGTITPALAVKGFDGATWLSLGGDTFGNTALGSSALTQNTTGSNNSAFGYQALSLNDVGTNNSAMGRAALYSNTTGYNNSALGASALFNNTTGYKNSAVGSWALSYNTNGYSNSALGYTTLFSNTTGYKNSAVGAEALASNTTGYENSALGFNALADNTTGYENLALGALALYSNTTGILNSALGFNALADNTTGYNNSALGASALFNNTTGYYNTALGTEALYSLKPTSEIISHFADSSYNPGVYTTVTSANSLSDGTTVTIYGTTNYDGSWTVANTTASTFDIPTAFAGDDATGWWGIDSEGQNNTAVGYSAGNKLTTGSNNILLGSQVANNLTTGSNNIVLGNGIYTPAADSVNTLNIGNLLYGTNIDGTGYTLSTGNIGIGISAPVAKLHLTGAVPGKALAIFDETGDQAIFTASASGVPEMTVLHDGTLQFHQANSITTTTGNLTLQPAGTGTSANVQIGAGGVGSTTPDLLVLDVGSDVSDPAGGTDGAMYYNAVLGKLRCFQAGSWVDCGAGGTGSSDWTTTLDGIIYPTNQSLDLLLGGSASSSAKFAFLNVNSGNPTASISGNLALGAETTSNNPATFLNIYNGGSFNIQGSAGGDTGLASRLFIDNTGKVGINTAAPGAALDVNGNVLVAGNGTIDTSTAGTLGIGTTTQTGLTLGNSSATTSLVGSNVTQGGIGYGDINNTLAFTTALTGVLEANGTSAPTALTSTQDYVAYWSDANTISGEAQLALSRGGTNADLSGVNAGGLIYMGGSSALTGTDALSGLLYGEGSSGPAAVTGLTDSYLPKYSNSSPYLTDSLIYDNGINVGINTVSPSETLDVNGNATVSGNLTLYGAARSIQGVNSLDLTIGGDTTGNIFLQPFGTSTTGYVQIGAGGVGSTTPDLLVLDVGSDVSDPAGGTDGAMYYNAVLGKLRCFQAGSWVDCGAGGTGSSDWTTTLDGIIYPTNQSLDLLLGGSASSSAKFAFLNVNSGIPTASISGTLANVATFIDGNGNISTTNAQDLTLGNSSTYSTTGNILLNPNGTGNVGIGTLSPTAKLDVNGTASISGELDLYGNPVIQSTANQNLTLGGATTGNIILSPLGGTGTVTFSGYGAGIIQSDALGVLSSAVGTANYLPKWSSTAPYLTATSLVYDNGTNVGINTVSPSETLDVNGNATVSGNLTFYGLSSTLATRNSVNLNIGDLQTGTIQFYNSNNTLDSSGNLTIAGTTTFNGNTYTWPVPLSQSTNYVLTTNGSGGLTWENPTSLIGGTSYWLQTDGALYPKNSTVDLLIGASSTDSAKFAFLNVNSGNPTASIAGNLALGAPTTLNPATFLNIYNGGSFNIQGSVGGDAGLTSRLFIDNSGQIGIGNVTSPTATVDISSPATNGNGVNLVANNLTSGNAMSISSTSQAGAASGNSYLLNLSSNPPGANANSAHTTYGVASSITNTGTSSTNIAGYFTAIGASSNYGLEVGAMNVGSGSSATGLDIEAISGSGTGTGIAIKNISSTGATNYGLNIGNISGATTTDYGINIGTLTGGTGSSVYGINTGVLTSVASGTNYQINLGAVAGATSATFGSINTGALSGSGTTSYGINLGSNSSTATTNYGIDIGAISGAGTNNYGLYVGNVSGATNNYAAIFQGGKVGIGTTTPDAMLQLTGAAIGKALAILNETGDQRILVASASGVTKFSVDRSGNISGAGVLQVADSSAVNSVAYSRFGTSTPPAQVPVSTSQDVLVSNNLGVGGILYLIGDEAANSYGTNAIGLCVQSTLPGCDTTTTNNIQNELDSGSWIIRNDANAGAAALMVDQQFGGDIFSASSSAGTTKFTIHNDGSITLAGLSSPTINTLNGTIYYDTTKTRNNVDTGDLMLYGQDSAFHRIALDMTEYSTSAANIVNGGYVQATHSSTPTNELSLTGWFLDSISNTWKTISSWAQTVINNLNNQFNNSATAQEQKVTTVSLQYQQDSTGSGADSSIGDAGNPISSGTYNLSATSFIKNRSCADGGDAVHYNVTGLDTGSGVSATWATINKSPSTGCLAVGDEVLIINLRGNSTSFGNVGHWETTKISSISSNKIYFTTPLTNWYGDASDDSDIGLGTGAQSVMLQRVPNYTSVTINSGVNIQGGPWLPPTGNAGNGVGGVVFFRATGAVTISGSVNTNYQGYTGGAAIGGSANEPGGAGGESFCGPGGAIGNGAVGGNGAAGGGGSGGSYAGGTGYCGGGGGGGNSGAARGTGSAGQGGAGGGGGGFVGAGGGGGYGTYGNGGGGNSGTAANGGTTQSGNGGGGATGGGNGGGGGGGGTYGDPNLTTSLMLGSAGGSGGILTTGTSGGGGNGGGIIYIAGNSVTVSGTLGANGGNGIAGSAGGAQYYGGGGAGAGGSIKVVGATIDLGGTSKTTAIGGTSGSAGYWNGNGSGLNGGVGGNGRIAVGSTTNSISNQSNPNYVTLTPNYNPYALYISQPINTPDTTAFHTISWTQNLPSGTQIEMQTRSGNSATPTDGTWEAWKPTTSSVSIENAGNAAAWTTSNATAATGDVVRNVANFEDETENNPANLTKLTATAANGYAQRTNLSSTNLTTACGGGACNYITLWLRSSGSGQVVTLGFGNSDPTINTKTFYIDQANTWQKVYWDISSIASNNNAVQAFRITDIPNGNVIWFDNIQTETDLNTYGGSTITSSAGNYIQYRAILSTTNSANSPTLSNVQINLTNASGTYTIDANSITNSDAIVQTNTPRNITPITLQYSLYSTGTGADSSIGDAGNPISSGTYNLSATSFIKNRSCADGGDAVHYNVTGLDTGSGVSATWATINKSPSTGCLAVGDEVLIINLRGNSTSFGNVGHWETTKISSISSNKIYFTTPLTNWYGDASDDSDIGLGTGAQSVMLQRVPNYTSVTINSGVNIQGGPWLPPTGNAGNGVGGVVFFRATGAVTISGSVNTNYQGYTGGAAIGGSANEPGGAGGESFCGPGGAIGNGAVGGNGAAGGGGSGGSYAGGTGYCGGGGGGGNSGAARGTGSAGQGGAGGGGGGFVGAGGGGGYGTYGNGGGGNSGTAANGGTTQSGNGGGGATGGGNGGGGGGGGTYGDPNLTTSLMLGSAGGSGGILTTGTSGGGGNGGGIIYIAGNSVTVSGTLGANGGNGIAGSAGGAQYYGGGGAGAGGSIKVVGATIDLGGTSKTTAIGGTSGSAGYWNGNGSGLNGGVGGNGRIAVYDTSSISNNSNPSYNVDTSTGAYNTYSVYVSKEIATTGATAFGNIAWSENLPSGTQIEMQTRSGNTSNSTDGTWEGWKPTTSQLVLQNANDYTQWAVTNATRADGNIARTVNYYEDENITAGNAANKTTQFTAGNGVIQTISLNGAGSGYSTGGGTLTITGGGGSGGTASYTAVNGNINTIKVANGGSGYSGSNCVLTISGGSGNATATPTFSSGAVSAVSLTSGGGGYSVSQGAATTGGSGTGATINITGVAGNGSINTITLGNGGSGYAASGTLTITGGVGNGTATFTSTGGVVSAVTLSNHGLSYSLNQGAATTISGTGCAGSGAYVDIEGTTDGVVTSVTLTNGGSSYAVTTAAATTSSPGSGATVNILTLNTGGYVEATLSPTQDIHSYQYITAWIRSATAGSVVTMGFGSTGGNGSDHTYTPVINTANTWQKVYWDISTLTGVDTAVKYLRFSTSVNSNVVYIDNITAESDMSTYGGIQIPSTYNNYIQYRAILTTTTSLNTPTLSNVTINYTTGAGSQTTSDLLANQNNQDQYNQNTRLLITSVNLATYKSIGINKEPTDITTTGAINPGSGNDGNVTVSTNTDINATSLISGRTCADGGDAVNYSVTALTATSATLTQAPSAGCLAVGDEVLLINLQGNTTAFANVGKWETLKISSINQNIINFTTAKANYYGDGATNDNNIGTASSNQRVMLQRVPNYNNLVVNAGVSFYPNAWNDVLGGVFFVRAKTASIDGTVSASGKGYIGAAGTSGSGALPGGTGGESFCGPGGAIGNGAVGGNGAAGGGGSGGSYAGGTGYCGGGGGGGNSGAAGGTGSANQGGAGGGGGGFVGAGGGGGYGTYGNGGGGNSGTAANGGTTQSGNGGGGATGGGNGGGGGGGGTYGDANLTRLMFGSAAVQEEYSLLVPRVAVATAGASSTSPATP